MSFLLLGLLVLVDGLFCGFRSAAGRNPRIRLWGYYRRAMVRGLLAAAAVIAVFLAAATVGAQLLGPAVWDALERDAARLTAFYGVYATLVLTAIALYATASFDLAVLASVLVLGPFTLVRPWVIGAGALWVASSPASALGAALALGGATVMAFFERLLELGRPPWRGALPPRPWLPPRP